VAGPGSARQGLAWRGEAPHTAHSREWAAVGPGKAGQGTAWPGWAWLGVAGQGYTHGAFHGVRRSVVWSKSVSPGTHQTRDFVVWRGEAWQGKAWRGKAWPGGARPGGAWQGYTHGAFHGVRRSVVWRGLAWHGLARQGLARLGGAWLG